MTVDEAEELVEEIEQLADEVPSAGQDFAQSVVEKSQSILRTIERTDQVTGGQEAALENMRDGLQRWWQ